MPRQIVHVNSRFQQNNKPFIDTISKVYIAFESILGLNRIPVILNKSKCIGTSIAFAYSVLVIVFIQYMVYIRESYKSIVTLMIVIEFMFTVIFSFITWKRVALYYNALNQFDTDIGCRPKTTRKSIANLLFVLAFNTSVSAYYLSLIFPCDMNLFCVYIFSVNIPVNYVFQLEVHYYGHLLSLLVPRLSLINFYVKKELSDEKLNPNPNIEMLTTVPFKNFKKSLKMQKLMDLYHSVIKAHDILNDAIKWQLLVALVTLFISTLAYLYDVSTRGIHGQLSIFDTIKELSHAVIKLVPMYSPCIFCDDIQEMVRKLRHLLTSRLYENTLDKPGRSAARGLLVMTEARDLSFSLLRMLQIDSALPFKFTGLLLTYLIILIQFDKVLNPHKTYLE